VFDRPTVEKFTAALLDGGAEAATALSRQRGVRRFPAWLAEEGETNRDELAGLHRRARAQTLGEAIQHDWTFALRSISLKDQAAAG
jgi:site-specific recombinase XerC